MSLFIKCVSQLRPSAKIFSTKMRGTLKACTIKYFTLVITVNVLRKCVCPFHTLPPLFNVCDQGQSFHAKAKAGRELLLEGKAKYG
jgi:hypothetical protein